MSIHHDRMLAEPYAEDEGFNGDPEAAIEEMAHVPDCYDNWLSVPPSISHLLALLADGVPIDDEPRVKLADAITDVRFDFVRWALRPERFKAAPVDAWISERGAV